MRPFFPFLGVLLVALAGCQPSATLSVAQAPGTFPQAFPADGAAASPAGSTAGHNTIAAEKAACAGFAGAATRLSPPASEAGAPAIARDQRYDLALSAAPGGNEGVVSFKAPFAAEWSVFYDQDAFLVVRDADGAVQPAVEIAHGSDQCGAIKLQRVYMLAPGAYTLDFGPVAASALSVLVTETHPDVPKGP